MTDQQQDVEQTKALATARWAGDSATLPSGAEVDILAFDPGARLSRAHGVTGVPARAACWIRWWPANRDYASYRSCELADLDLSDEQYDALARSGNALRERYAIYQQKLRKADPSGEDCYSKHDTLQFVLEAIELLAWEMGVDLSARHDEQGATT